MKLTPQRLAILEYLDGNKAHPSAEDVYRAVRRKFPTISFATVYNNLSMLCKRGMAQEIGIDPGRMRYDPDTSAHHHLICTSCGRVADIFKSFDISLSESELGGFKLSTSRVEFHGICPDCGTKGGH